MISTNEIYSVLLFEFPYFKKINEEKRQLLCKRTQQFIEGTDFISRKGLVLTNRMLILISACSQQLTLGFSRYYNYAYFEKIVIYPEKYFSTITEKYHIGEMNTAGVVVLSWEDFYKGISIDNDAHNVGLHEFAHALEFTDIANKDIDETFSACLDKFTVVADHYLHHQPDIPLFRSYATTNLSEFFAVATEYYFEAPKEFAEKEPELFDILNKAYQQNTAPKTRRENQTVLPKPKREDLFFGNYEPIASGGMELVVYIVAGFLAGALILSKEFYVMGILLFIGSIYVIYTYAFKAYFSLYAKQVQIHQPLMKRLIRSVLYQESMQDMYIDYSNVLYVSADEVYGDQVNHSFQRQQDGMNYTLCYWDKGCIEYAKLTTTNTNYDWVLSFLYRQKKVGTRINGMFKKYKISTDGEEKLI